MLGTVLYGQSGVRFGDREEPRIEKPTDAVIRIAVKLSADRTYGAIAARRPHVRNRFFKGDVEAMKAKLWSVP